MTSAFQPSYIEGELVCADSHGNIAKQPVPLSYVPEKAAIIDWLALTIKTNDPLLTIKFLKTFLFDELGIETSLWEYRENKGWNGYKHTIQLDKYGLIAYGGDSQRNTVYLSINGTGCNEVKSWQRIHDWVIKEHHKITRIDLAHDDYLGLNVNFRNCLIWEKKGLFTGKGRPPEAGFRHDLNSGKGKTFEVGNRKNGKYCRIYEKGRQLGDSDSPWMRAEVEYRAVKRILPPDMILYPERYLASSYPAFAFISEQQERLKTISKVTTITYEQSVEWVRRAAGKHINAIIQANYGDIGAALELIVRDGLPDRLEVNSEYFPRCIDQGTNK